MALENWKFKPIKDSDTKRDGFLFIGTYNDQFHYYFQAREASLYSYERFEIWASKAIERGWAYNDLIYDRHHYSQLIMIDNKISKLQDRFFTFRRRFQNSLN